MFEEWFDTAYDSFFGAPATRDTEFGGSLVGPGSRFLNGSGHTTRDANGDEVGSAVSLNAVNGQFDVFGQPVQVSSGININEGAWLDENGEVTRGYHADASSAKVNTMFGDPSSKQIGQYFGIEASAPDASIEAVVGPNTASIGAQANLASAAITAGTTGSNHDQSARFGLSEGIGAAGRVHYGDADGDGLNEYGLGFDFGPVSADIKSEDPLRKAAELMSMGFLQPDMTPGDSTNWTQTAGSALSTAGSAISDTASNVSDWWDSW